MLIQTKYAIGEPIWFLACSQLQCSHITGIETFTNENGVSVAYRTEITGLAESKLPVSVGEVNAFSSKDELLQTLVERFHASIDAGSA
jgi:hypothetical protein